MISGRINDCHNLPNFLSPQNLFHMLHTLVFTDVDSFVRMQVAVFHGFVASLLHTTSAVGAHEVYMLESFCTLSGLGAGASKCEIQNVIPLA